MMFVGLVLVTAAIAVAVGVVLANGDPVEVSVFGERISGVDSEWQLFAAGATVAVVFVAGVLLAGLGIRRTLDLRRELRELRDGRELEISTLEMEKRALQQELARARGGVPAPRGPMG